jgi:inner membrane transporter RhtA
MSSFYPLALAVALISSAVPVSLELYALPRLPAQTFAVLTSLEPVFGVIVGFFLLNEVLAGSQVAGIMIVMVAAAGAAWRAT